MFCGSSLQCHGLSFRRPIIDKLTKRFSLYNPLSYDREHFQYLSGLRIVGTCDILVYRMRHQIMWSAWLVASKMLSICVITRHLNLSLLENVSKNVLESKNLIIVSLNTLIPIIVIVQLDVPTNGLYIAFQCLLLFNVVFWVMHAAYRHKPNFSIEMCLSRQVDSLCTALGKTMLYNRF